MTVVAPARTCRFAAFETFRSPGYRCLWAASLLWNQARWMDQVVLGWVVLEMTTSGGHLAVIGALRWLPLLMFGVAGGAVADRVDRRWLLIGAPALGLGVWLGTALLLVSGRFDFTFAALATFLLGLQWAVDWPTRRALIPDLVGRGLTVDAIALDALRAAPGRGSFVGALAIAFSRSVPRSGLMFWAGSCLTSTCLVGFALSGNLILALALLGLSGLGQAAFASLQSTIVLGRASDQLRGRAMGALTLAIGSSPLGTLEIGAVTVWLGAPLAVALNAGACAALVGVVAQRLPKFRAS